MALNLWFDYLMENKGYQVQRRSRRLKIGQPVKLRPSDTRGEAFEEIGTTKNMSREGFYFHTGRTSYVEGMRLIVTLPYHWPPDLRDREYVGQVIRVEPLEDGQHGVAVQLLSSLTGTTPSELPTYKPR